MVRDSTLSWMGYVRGVTTSNRRRFVSGRHTTDRPSRAARIDGRTTSESGCHRAASDTFGPRPASATTSMGMPCVGAFADTNCLMTDSNRPVLVTGSGGCWSSALPGSGRHSRRSMTAESSVTWNVHLGSRGPDVSHAVTGPPRTCSPRSDTWTRAPGCRRTSAR